MIPTTSQVFFWDDKNNIFYLVNFQEKTYMKIAEEGSQYWELCNHLYCPRWKHENNYNIVSTFKKVNTLRQMDGTDEI